MKIPLPDSPLISPFLEVPQKRKLIDNLPPEKTFPPDKNKNNLSPIFNGPRKISEIFSPEVQGTKYSTTKVDGRTSENRKQMDAENEKRTSNNTSIIDSSKVKTMTTLKEKRVPFSPLSNKISFELKN